LSAWHHLGIYSSRRFTTFNLADNIELIDSINSLSVRAYVQTTGGGTDVEMVAAEIQRVYGIPKDYFADKKLNDSKPRDVCQIRSPGMCRTVSYSR